MHKTCGHILHDNTSQHHFWTLVEPSNSSDVTISKFRFSIDFDSILVTPTLNHSRQNKIPWQQTPGGRLQSHLLPLQNRPAFANWCELARYVSADNSLPVTSDRSPTHLAFADVKVTGETTMFPRSHLSRTTHQQHSQKLDAWHWRWQCGYNTQRSRYMRTAAWLH